MADQFELDHSDGDVMRALASIGAEPFAYRTLGTVFEPAPEVALIAAPLRRPVAAPPITGQAVSCATSLEPSWLARLLARQVSAGPPAVPVRDAGWLSRALEASPYSPPTTARPMADILL